MRHGLGARRSAVLGPGSGKQKAGRDRKVVSIVDNNVFGWAEVAAMEKGRLGASAELRARPAADRGNDKGITR